MQRVTPALFTTAALGRLLADYYVIRYARSLVVSVDTQDWSREAIFRSPRKIPDAGTFRIAAANG